MARQAEVTVVGAGFYGSTTAQRLAEYDVFDEVVLTDIIEGKPEGLQPRPEPVEADRGFRDEGHRPVDPVPTVRMKPSPGPTWWSSPPDCPCKPGMSRMDLIETNAKIMRAVAENVAKACPRTL